MMNIYNRGIPASYRTLAFGLDAMDGPSINRVGSTGFLSSRVSWFIVFFIFLNLSLLSISVGSSERAIAPPRGWNSYDSFCWIISEEEFLQSAEIVSQRLHPHGYEYVVVDYLWYRRKVEGAYTDSHGFDVIDQWGRVQPDPERWPSSKDGKGFTEVANKVHGMGLKFGIHVMAGISTQAFNSNTLILDPVTGDAYQESGRQWRAQDIGVKEKACAWMPHGFMSVNTKLGAGRAFLKSLYLQYAEWGVDFIKHDCVFGDDFNLDEITYVSEVLRELNRPVLYSLSPGTSVTPAMAKEVSSLVNMYRITGDDWDSWKDVLAHFDVSRDMSASDMIGAEGLLGKSWPDLDMLPLGWLTDPGSNFGPHRPCRLTLDEQRTQMTLWAIAKSPLMFGGDVRNLDDGTYSLITNPTLLDINSYGSNTKEFPYVTGINVSTRKRKNNPREPTEGDMTTKLAFGLTSCKEPKASEWSISGLDENHRQICWNQNLQSNKLARRPFCLYNRKRRIASDEELRQNQIYRGKLHVVTSDRTASSCLGASPKQRLTSKDYSRGALSPCKADDANQMWELHRNGTLQNGYSGLCAVLKQVAAGSNGVRAWISRGRSGEVYLAFFNLNEVKTEISAKVGDLSKALPDKNLEGASCESSELWSGQRFGPTKDSVSIQVPPHGSALFTLSCSRA
ncbi:PREDICTED: probable alpha-galactosidase B [Tarenaya hassleriana]|uniref:probable alpha-galactosidase B n=1 Tax=Tarenaya hassleriana TaxID=28532 RepID=UPI00053CAA42|nr:PREDICTED: probable alpha-galactosidase B [Tarenaya hassleriana]